MVEQKLRNVCRVRSMICVVPVIIAVAVAPFLPAAIGAPLLMLPQADAGVAGEAAAVTQSAGSTGDFGRLLLALLIMMLVPVVAHLIDGAAASRGARSTRPVLILRFAVGLWMLLFALSAAAIGALLAPASSPMMLLVFAAVAASLLIGFRDDLGNAAAGIRLAFRPPFQVGDRLEVGGVAGRVASVGIMSTSIEAADGTRVALPNARLVRHAVGVRGGMPGAWPTSISLPADASVGLAAAREAAHQAVVTSRFTALEHPVEVHVEPTDNVAREYRIRISASIIDPRFECDFVSEVTEAVADRLMGDDARSRDADVALRVRV